MPKSFILELLAGELGALDNRVADAFRGLLDTLPDVTLPDLLRSTLYLSGSTLDSRVVRRLDRRNDRA